MPVTLPKRIFAHVALQMAIRDATMHAFYSVLGVRPKPLYLIRVNLGAVLAIFDVLLRFVAHGIVLIAFFRQRLVDVKLVREYFAALLDVFSDDGKDGVPFAVGNDLGDNSTGARQFVLLPSLSRDPKGFKNPLGLLLAHSLAIYLYKLSCALGMTLQVLIFPTVKETRTNTVIHVHDRILQQPR